MFSTQIAMTAMTAATTARPYGTLLPTSGHVVDRDRRGVIGAVKEVSLQIPLVVRLEGTNVEEGRRLMQESGLPIISASDLDEAAEKIVAATK